MRDTVARAFALLASYQTDPLAVDPRALHEASEAVRRLAPPEGQADAFHALRLAMEAAAHDAGALQSEDGAKIRTHEFARERTLREAQSTARREKFARERDAAEKVPQSAPKPKSKPVEGQRFTVGDAVITTTLERFDSPPPETASTALGGVDPNLWTVRPKYGPAGGPDVVVLTDEGNDRAWSVGARVRSGPPAKALEALRAAGGHGPLDKREGSRRMQTDLGRFNLAWLDLVGLRLNYVERYVEQDGLAAVRLTALGLAACADGDAERERLLERCKAAAGLSETANEKLVLARKLDAAAIDKIEQAAEIQGKVPEKAVAKLLAEAEDLGRKAETLVASAQAPAEDVARYQGILALAADDRARLRASDVDRVLTEARRARCLDGFVAWLREGIRDARVDQEIKDWIDESDADLAEKRLAGREQAAAADAAAEQAAALALVEQAEAEAEAGAADLPEPDAEIEALAKLELDQGVAMRKAIFGAFDKRMREARLVNVGVARRVDEAREAAEKAEREESKRTTTLKPGDVVHFADGRTRRFVIAELDPWGNFNLTALSGGDAGSGPSGVSPDKLTLDRDQAVTFSGVEAGKRERDYKNALRRAEERPKHDAELRRRIAKREAEQEGVRSTYTVKEIVHENAPRVAEDAFRYQIVWSESGNLHDASLEVRKDKAPKVDELDLMNAIRRAAHDVDQEVKAKKRARGTYDKTMIRRSDGQECRVDIDEKMQTAKSLSDVTAGFSMRPKPGPSMQRAARAHEPVMADADIVPGIYPTGDGLNTRFRAPRGPVFPHKCVGEMCADITHRQFHSIAKHLQHLDYVIASDPGAEQSREVFRVLAELKARADAAKAAVKRAVAKVEVVEAAREKVLAKAEEKATRDPRMQKLSQRKPKSAVEERMLAKAAEAIVAEKVAEVAVEAPKLVATATVGAEEAARDLAQAEREAVAVVAEEKRVRAVAAKGAESAPKAPKAPKKIDVKLGQDDSGSFNRLIGDVSKPGSKYEPTEIVAAYGPLVMFKHNNAYKLAHRASGFPIAFEYQKAQAEDALRRFAASPEAQALMASIGDTEKGLSSKDAARLKPVADLLNPKAAADRLRQENLSRAAEDVARLNAGATEDGSCLCLPNEPMESLAKNPSVDMIYLQEGGWDPVVFKRRRIEEVLRETPDRGRKIGINCDIHKPGFAQVRWQNQFGRTGGLNLRGDPYEPGSEIVVAKLPSPGAREKLDRNREALLAAEEAKRKFDEETKRMVKDASEKAQAMHLRSEAADKIPEATRHLNQANELMGEARHAEARARDAAAEARARDAAEKADSGERRNANARLAQATRERQVAEGAVHRALTNLRIVTEYAAEHARMGDFRAKSAARFKGLPVKAPAPPAVAEPARDFTWKASGALALVPEGWKPPVGYELAVSQNIPLGALTENQAFNTVREIIYKLPMLPPEIAMSNKPSRPWLDDEAMRAVQKTHALMMKGAVSSGRAALYFKPGSSYPPPAAAPAPGKRPAGRGRIAVPADAPEGQCLIIRILATDGAKITDTADFPEGAAGRRAAAEWIRAWTDAVAPANDRGKIEVDSIGNNCFEPGPLIVPQRGAGWTTKRQGWL